MPMSVYLTIYRALAARRLAPAGINARVRVFHLEPIARAAAARPTNWCYEGSPLWERAQEVPTWDRAQPDVQRNHDKIGIRPAREDHRPADDPAHVAGVGKIRVSQGC